MKKLIWIVGFVAAFAIPHYANSQQAPAAPQEYTLKVSAADVDLIGKALGKVSFDEAAPVIQRLREQIYAQQQAQAKPETKPEEKK